MKKLLKNFLFVIFLPIISIDALTDQQKCDVQKYCKEMAAQLSVPEIRFDFSEKPPLPMPVNPAGYYDPVGKYIWLKPSIVESFALGKTNYLDDVLTLLHEIGHAVSCKKWKAYYLFMDHVAKYLTGKTVADQEEADAITCITFVRQREELYADRFAIRNACKIYGYKRVQEWLEEEDSFCEFFGVEREKIWPGRVLFSDLLRYSKKLEDHDLLIERLNNKEVDFNYFI